MLKEVAQVTRRVLRDVDVLARYGGEELVALLPETSREDAFAAAERMRQGVAGLRLPFSSPGKPTVDVQCTASIGVATYPPPGIDVQDALVAAADECLYAAKQNGRNQVQQHEH